MSNQGCSSASQPKAVDNGQPGWDENYEALARPAIVVLCIAIALVAIFPFLELLTR